MKNIKAILISASISLANLGYSQVLVETDINLGVSTGYTDIVNGMTTGFDKDSFNNGFNSVAFDTATNTWFSDTDSIFNDGGTTAGSTMFFSIMPVNIESFLVFDLPVVTEADESRIRVAFVGRDNWDRDDLMVEAYDPDTNAFLNSHVLVEDYSIKNPDPAAAPPIAAKYMMDGGDGKVVISHYNPKINTVSDQSREERFKIFRQYDPANGNAFLDSWILAVDDRENSRIDYNDGVFWVDAQNVVVVPEPSLIAGIALVGLAGIVFFRRRKTATAQA